ncbi:hypothetical protein GCM10010910_16270 [Microbacterium nanhaiense]|uniref:DUF3060 domain-containing protein n=1 Tax=Microbacterium nanhaiense TaxID=1301026 RepID=A0ABQ2N077_9MICO|nr:DUF3060 domain-containing protein [Microbacterium nanhaiense]GGO63520.1 hypothetical protein GCM10010910_16270 [Microbacterium nanhaiense]
MRALPVITLSALLLVGLTGCSVAVSEPDEQATTADNAASDASEDTSETGSAGEPAGEAGEPAETVSEDPEPEESELSSSDGAGADSGAEDAGGDEAGADSDGATSWSAEEAAYRDSMLELVTRTLTCDGELVFGKNEPGQIVRIDGPCEHVVVHMDAGVVIAEEVGSIEVSGAGNVIYLDGVDTISVAGDANAISWLGATPQVTDTGAGNVIVSGS